MLEDCNYFCIVATQKHDLFETFKTFKVQSKPSREEKTCKYEKSRDKTICSPLKYGSCLFLFSKMEWNQIYEYFQMGEGGWVFILERNSLNMFLHGNHQIFFLIQSLCPSQTLRGPNCISLDSWGPNRGKVGRIGSRRTKMGQGPKHTMLDQGWPSGPSGQ